MEKLRWSDHFKTGIPSIDRDHRELFGQISGFTEAAANGSSRDVLGDLLEFLNQYTQHHFSREEALMKKVGYPRFSEHKLAHENFMTKTTELISGFHSQSSINPVHIGEFLSQWWFNHVLNEDFAFLPWHESLVKNP